MRIREYLTGLKQTIELENTTLDEMAKTFLSLPPLVGSIVTVRNSTYVWDDDRWRTPENFDLPDYVRLFAGKCTFPGFKGQPQPLDCPGWRVKGCIDTMESITRVPLSPTESLPIWGGAGKPPVDPKYAISLRDCIVDLGATAAARDKDPDAPWVTVPRTREWIDPVVLPATLSEVQATPAPELARALTRWGEGDPEWTELWLRMTAYTMMPYRDFQKAFLLTGKARAGKGIWSRLTSKLLGSENTFSTDLERFVYSHGLQGAERARLLVLTEVGAGEQAIGAQVRRYANTIIGQDPVVINPKGTARFEQRLPGALVMVGNEIPDVEDNANSFWNKVCVLPYRVSFIDQPDRGLEDRLWAEKAGIIREVLEGGIRLLQAGTWPSPRAEAAIKQGLRRLNSPIEAFADDRCEPNPRLHTSKSYLYEQFVDWCDHYDIPPMPRQTFFRKLWGSNLPVTAGRRGKQGEQEQVVIGLRVLPNKDR